MVKEDLDAMIVAALDEVAWLLNIRGQDVPNSPLVKGYFYLSMSQVVFFVHLDKILREPQVLDHLNNKPNCTGHNRDKDLCVE